MDDSVWLTQRQSRSHLFCHARSLLTVCSCFRDTPAGLRLLKSKRDAQFSTAEVDGASSATTADDDIELAMSVDVEDGEEDDENEPLIESDDNDCDDSDA